MESKNTEKYMSLPKTFDPEKYREQKEKEGGITNSVGIIRMPSGDIDITLLVYALDAIYINEKNDDGK